MSGEGAGRAEARHAQDALAAVEEMERAGARRGVPPRWFAVWMAAVIGLAWAFNAFEGGWWSLVSAVLVLLLIFGCGPLTRRSGALGRWFWGDTGPLGWWYLASGAGWLALGIWGERNGYPWFWAVGGAALAVETLIYYEVARRAWLRGRRTNRPGGPRA